MNKIGFDLGTTTTSISFFNSEKNAYDYLHFGGNSRDFFPSVIAYRKRNEIEERKIGTSAKKVLHVPIYDSYDNLKINLNSTAKNRQGHKKSVFEATRDFIGIAISEYLHVNNIKPDKIDEIVFTIPDS